MNADDPMYRGVSVVIPTSGRESVARAVKSVLEQTRSGI
jgi:hypothetical protein